MKNVLGWTLIASLAVCTASFGQDKAGKAKGKGKGGSSYPPTLEGAILEVYRTVGEVKLNAYIFNPPAHQPSDKRPAILFFFGGGWTSGSPSQFEQQARYLAGRGMVAITCDYRVASRHQVKAVECVKDAQSAMRWARSNAARLGIDPDRIVSSGGSAGGHLAACVGTLEDLEPASPAVSSKSNAMILFNPAMALAPIDGAASNDPRAVSIGERTGIDPKAISPAHHVKPGVPPTIQFFGTDDSLLAGAQEFDRRMKSAGNRSELAVYPGEKHGFFNFGRGDNTHFIKTLKAADAFLVSLGYLSGPDTVDSFKTAR